MTASSHNHTRHGAFRQYFDRPILVDNTGNLQLHHRHLSIRADHDSLHKMDPDQVVMLFRGLTISLPHEPGLYEVRVEKSLGKVDATAMDSDKLVNSIKLGKSTRLTREEKEQRHFYFSKRSTVVASLVLC